MLSFSLTLALTSVIAKSFKRLMFKQLTASAADRLDPLQFVFRAGRGVEDATLALFNLIANHLDTTGSHMQALFREFSSAFDIIQLHLLLKRFWILA